MNLMNLPYSLFVGGKDAAYKRNELVAEWGKRLDSLQAVYKGKFIHETHVYPDLPHWMNRNDTIAVPWMAGFKRMSLPQEIYWIQDDILRNQFYWLGTDINQAKQGLTAHVSVSGNEISILNNQNQTLYIYLNDGVLNLDKKVSVIINGKKVFNEKVRRNADVIRQSIAARLDKSLIFSAKLVITGGKVSII